MRSISWVKGRYIEISCRDLTDTVLARGTTISTLSKMEFDMNSYSQDLIRQSTYDEPITHELIANYFKIAFTVRSLAYYQQQLLGETDAQIECFDVNAQCQDLCDLVYRRAAFRGLKLTLVKDPGIPSSLSSNQNAHNMLIYAILQYAVSKSINNSEVTLALSSSNVTECAWDLIYRFTLQTKTPRAISSVIAIDSRKTFTELFSYAKEYGLELAGASVYLDALSCSEVDTRYIEDQNELIIQVKIPFEKGYSETETLIMKTHNSVRIGNNVTWTPPVENPGKGLKGLKIDKCAGCSIRPPRKSIDSKFLSTGSPYSAGYTARSFAAMCKEFNRPGSSDKAT